MLVVSGKPTEANALFTVRKNEGAARVDETAELAEFAAAALGHCMLNVTTTPV
jgi:hypothetical protein